MKYKFIENNKANDEEYEETQKSDMFLNYAKRTQVAQEVNIHIDEAIRDPKYYRLVVQELASVGEGDQVVIRINSPGGNLGGLVSLIEAIRTCDADILAVITGDAHSAASMLALSCPNVAVTPYANMLVHFVSFGAGGKAQDVVSHVQHTVDYSKEIFRDIYQGFLTETEMQEIISGKELWLKATEIEDRLVKRLKFYQDKEAAEKEPEKPKKKPRNKPSDTELNRSANPEVMYS